jgi:hypothetical protein
VTTITAAATYTLVAAPLWITTAVNVLFFFTALARLFLKLRLMMQASEQMKKKWSRWDLGNCEFSFLIVITLDIRLGLRKLLLKTLEFNSHPAQFYSLEVWHRNELILGSCRTNPSAMSNAERDANELQAFSQTKEGKKRKVIKTLQIQRLVAERLRLLKVVYCIWCIERGSGK